MGLVPGQENIFNILNNTYSTYTQVCVYVKKKSEL